MIQNHVKIGDTKTDCDHDSKSKKKSMSRSLQIQIHVGSILLEEGILKRNDMNRSKELRAHSLMRPSQDAVMTFDY